METATTSLPRIVHPKFPFELPSTRQTLELRPFLVKEEKIALMAAQTDNLATKMDSMLQILKNCIVEPPADFKLEDITLFDFEYLFLKLRCISVNNALEIQFVPDDKAPDVSFRMKIDLNEVNVQQGGEIYDSQKDRYTKQGKQISVGNGVGLMVRYPTVGVAQKLLAAGKLSDELNYDLLYACTTKVYDEKGVYNGFSREEFEEFFENLSSKSLDGLKEFFLNMPKIRHHAVYKDREGKNHEVLLEGLESFFG